MDIDGDKFDRQKRVASWNQEKIEKSKILIVGAGALGNEVFKLLMQLGVNNVTLVDFDKIVPANLNRCVFFSETDAKRNRLKAEVLKETGVNFNPSAKLEAVLKKVEELEESFFDKFDCCFSCLDNQSARLHLNAMCYNKMPLIDGGTFGFFGKVQVVSAPSPCIECSMSKRDYGLLWKKYSCVGETLDFIDPKMPAIATTTAIIASIQVNEFLKLTFGDQNKTDDKLSDNLVGKYLQFNGLKNETRIFQLETRKGCPLH